MDKIYDLLIVGGGLAGITAAIYAARKEIKFAIISPEFGGEIANTTYVENYPGFNSIDGKELAQKYVDHMKSFNNIEIIEDAVTEIKKEGNTFWVTTYGGTYKSKTVIWATGSKYRELQVPGEQELKSRGVTYCSTCDGPLFKNKTVVVVGAGNNGLTSAIYMKDIAKHVYLLNKNDTIKGDQVLLDRLKDPKVTIINNSRVKKIIGDKKVESVLIDNNGREESLHTEGVLVNVGYLPITEPIKNLVTLDKFGYLETDNKRMSKIPGFFAAGDVVNNPYKQLVVSAGDGCIAALGVYDYLISQKH
jgi:thioredoxin-disulfide reductase